VEGAADVTSNTGQSNTGPSNLDYLISGEWKTVGVCIVNHLVRLVLQRGNSP